MSDGVTLREQGFAQLDLATTWDRDQWPEQARRAIEWLARTGRTFTAEDVREMTGDPGRASLMGSVFLSAARVGLIERVGFKPAERPERRGGWVAQWRGVPDAA